MGGIPIERLQEKWDPEEIRLEDSPLLGGYMFNLVSRHQRLSCFVK